MTHDDREHLSRFYRERVLPYLHVEHVFVGLKFAARRRREWRAACPLHGGRGFNFAVNVETLLWRCHSECQCGGDAIKFVMMVEGLSFRDAVLELARRAGVDTSEIEHKPWSDPIAHGTTTETPKPFLRRSASMETSAAEYPPQGEVQELWSACRPVTDVLATVDWLVQRRVDPIRVADMDLARSLPAEGIALPDWARRGCRSWRGAGYQLIVPAHDAAGRMRSVVARNVIGDEVKSVPPQGHRRTGLVLACPLGLQLLKCGLRPGWWPGDVPLRVEIVEGEKKLLMRALSRSDADEYAPATLGIVSGSWSRELAARIPDGSSLYIATDPNAAGSNYAASIVETLAARIAAGVIGVELREPFRLAVDQSGKPTVKLAEVAA